MEPAYSGCPTPFLLCFCSASSVFAQLAPFLLHMIRVCSACPVFAPLDPFLLHFHRVCSACPVFALLAMFLLRLLRFRSDYSVFAPFFTWFARFLLRLLHFSFAQGSQAEIPFGWRLVVFQPSGTRLWHLAAIWWNLNDIHTIFILRWGLSHKSWPRG